MKARVEKAVGDNNETWHDWIYQAYGVISSASQHCFPAPEKLEEGCATLSRPCHLFEKIMNIAGEKGFEWLLRESFV